MKNAIFDELLKKCENEQQEIILYRLKDTDSENRVKRSELSELIHTDDRTMRSVVSDMRKNGIFIAGDTRSSGYYLPQTFDEFTLFAANYSGRAMATLYTQGQMFNSARELLLEQTKMEVNV